MNLDLDKFLVDIFKDAYHNPYNVQITIQGMVLIGIDKKEILKAIDDRRLVQIDNTRYYRLNEENK